MILGGYAMARDLSFWKYNKDGTFNHNEIYRKLSDEESVECVEMLPSDEIRKLINLKFASWNRLDDNHFELNGEAFEIMLTDQFARFDCYGMSEQNMNELIDIMLLFGCYLYDSSINVRFDGN